MPLKSFLNILPLQQHLPISFFFVLHVLKLFLNCYLFPDVAFDQLNRLEYSDWFFGCLRVVRVPLRQLLSLLSLVGTWLRWARYQLCLLWDNLVNPLALGKRLDVSAVDVRFVDWTTFNYKIFFVLKLCRQLQCCVLDLKVLGVRNINLFYFSLQKFSDRLDLFKNTARVQRTCRHSNIHFLLEHELERHLEVHLFGDVGEEQGSPVVRWVRVLRSAHLELNLFDLVARVEQATVVKVGGQDVGTGLEEGYA